MSYVPPDVAVWLDSLPAAGDDPTLIDHLRDESARGLQPSTLVTRRVVLRAVARQLSPHTLLTIPEPELLRWWRRTHGARGLAPATRVAARAHLRAFSRWALDEELRTDDPTRRLKAPRIVPLLPKPVPAGDVRRLLLAGDLAAHERLAVRLAVECGLRAHEITKVRPGDVTITHPAPGTAPAEHTAGDVADLEAAAAAAGEDFTAVLRVLGKGRKERAVPIPLDLAAAIAAGDPRRPVVTHPTRGPYTPDSLSGLLGTILRRHGIDASGHRLRHAYGTALFSASGDIRTVASALGHSNLTTASGYAAADPTRIRHAAAAAWNDLNPHAGPR